jgi:hypothetical protein
MRNKKGQAISLTLVGIQTIDSASTSVVTGKFECYAFNRLQ